jgi:hypothetical protein
MKPYPVCKTNCPTCPFIPGSKYANLAPSLAQSALTKASRICHSTGANNAINRRTGKRPRLCRGARDIQLAYFHGIGFIAEPTDAAWAAKLKEINKGKSHD